MHETWTGEPFDMFQDEGVWGRSGGQQLSHWRKDRTQFLSVLRSEVSGLGVDLGSRVLVVGGSDDDHDVLSRVGFKNVTVSDFETNQNVVAREAAAGPRCSIDVEDIQLPNDSFDLIFAHEVLHHCRSPHRALCEMLRTSKKYVMFLEPHDSQWMRWLVAMRLSFPFELPAVIHHHGKFGGVRNSQIPNYIYRWNRFEVLKTASSFMPERTFSLICHPYWDFNVDEYELSLRRKTKLGLITSAIGPRNFLGILRRLKGVLNWIPVTERQGNKFFCVVEKHEELQPWLCKSSEGIVFIDDSNGGARLRSGHARRSRQRCQMRAGK
jgi:SAM-dependent methyltransferase